MDAFGNLFFADTAFDRIRSISPDGIINTVAGDSLITSGSCYPPPCAEGAVNGFSGDGGPATLALLDNPEGIAVDASDNLFITDAGNSRIRKVSGPFSTDLPTPSITPRRNRSEFGGGRRTSIHVDGERVGVREWVDG